MQFDEYCSVSIVFDLSMSKIRNRLHLIYVMLFVSPAKHSGT